MMKVHQGKGGSVWVEEGITPLRPVTRLLTACFGEAQDHVLCMDLISFYSGSPCTGAKD